MWTMVTHTPNPVVK